MIAAMRMMKIDGADVSARRLSSLVRFVMVLV